MRSINRYHILELLLLCVAFIYYFFFSNKGLVLFDEGYFVHTAERILHNEIPYQDFSLQYGPLFFYLLAGVFKTFGIAIIVERLFAIAICILILLTTFLILNKLRSTSYIVIFLTFLISIAYGYPLLNIANIMWANVLVTLLCALSYLYWYEATGRKVLIYLGLLGILFAIAFTLKQNIGLACVITGSMLLIFSKRRHMSLILKDLVIVNSICFGLTILWLYYFFFKDNISGFYAVINFSKNFASSISFTLPPLSLIFQPLGIFKLLPYYIPLMFACFLLWYLSQKKIEWDKLGFALFVTTGFLVTIYPQSDLLHVYPFLGSVLVAALVFIYKSRLRVLVICLMVLMSVIGFYLTFFTKSYRYEPPYKELDKALSLPRAKDILVTNHDAENIEVVDIYLKKHTKQDDYIFVYPHAPMFYFIYEKKNPTKDPIYYLPTWHFDEDNVIIKDLKQKKVEYIITAGDYQYETDLSRFIQKQKQVFRSGNLIIFKITWKEGVPVKKDAVDKEKELQCSKQ